MRKPIKFKELIDLSYNKYKPQKAVTIEYEFEKNINYFNYRFDIFSLARAIKDKENKINNKKIAIISENRYEFIVTYLANIIIKNKVFIIDSNLSESEVEKIIKKHKINTIFFSNKNKDKIMKIFKINNECKTRNRKRSINLINFDSNNKFPIIDYEKIINIGRYIENYSINNIDNNAEEIANTVIVNKQGIKAYSEEELIRNAYIIGKNIRVSKRRKIQSIYEINSFYKIIIHILIPLIYGLNINFFNMKTDRKTKNIDIEEYYLEKAVITYKNINYQLETVDNTINIIKLDKKNTIFNKKKVLDTKEFVLIKNEKYETHKQQNKITI